MHLLPYLSRCLIAEQIIIYSRTTVSDARVVRTGTLAGVCSRIVPGPPGTWPGVVLGFEL